jgi:hypothetical protein
VRVYMQSAQAKVNFQILEATNPAELRAAGYLRAQTFYSYPPDRSEYSQRVRVQCSDCCPMHLMIYQVHGAVGVLHNP